VVEVYKGIGWPNAAPQLFPRHQLAGTLQQDRQDFEGTFLDLNPSTILVELAGMQICLKVGELDHLRLRSRPDHRRGTPIQ
jgi:hypothetical protein